MLFRSKISQRLIFNSILDSSELRQRSSTFEPSGSQEFDSILKHHNRKHEQTASDMLIMARNLKEQNELAGRIIREDTKVIFHF